MDNMDGSELDIRLDGNSSDLDNMAENPPIDCRSEEGIVIGLIDSLLVISNVLNEKVNSYVKGNGGMLSENIRQAFIDLDSDDSLTDIIYWGSISVELD
jgi:hypothetical protein